MAGSGSRSRSRSRSRGPKRAGSRGRSRTRSRSRSHPRRSSGSRSRSRGPYRKAGVPVFVARRRSRVRSRSRRRGGIDNDRALGDRIVKLLGRRPWSDVSAVSGVDYRAGRRDFAMESGPSDITAAVGEGKYVAKVTSAEVKVKIDSLKARECMQKAISLYMDFCGTQPMIYGHIFVLMAPIGAVAKTPAEVVKDTEVRRWEWSKCPARITIDVPPLKPWGKHLPDVQTADMYAIYAVFDIKRRNKDLGDDDIAVSVKSEFLFSGEFTAPTL